MILAAIAASCPFVQASTSGYITTSSAAGTSQVGPTAVYSGDTQQDGINAREAARRKAKTSEALELLQQGRTCYSQKEYVQALEKYEAAWKVVPKAPATHKLQEFLVKSKEENDA
jgi:acyl-[acyl carrier protein]--UDP-N-acetylglucosamine O-acyltransferase